MKFEDLNLRELSRVSIVGQEVDDVAALAKKPQLLLIACGDGALSLDFLSQLVDALVRVGENIVGGQIRKNAHDNRDADNRHRDAIQRDAARFERCDLVVFREEAEGDQRRDQNADRQRPVGDLEQHEAVVSEERVECDAVRLHIAADLRVVDDDGQDSDRDQHQRQDLQKLAEDVAVHDVRKRHIESPQHLGLIDLGGRDFSACSALAGNEGAYAGDHRSDQPCTGALRAGLAIRAAEEIDADGQQDEVGRPHREPRLYFSGHRELFAVVQHDVVHQDDHHAEREAGALSAAPIRDAERQA